MGTRLKFADVVLDIDEVVALIGSVAYLRDGRELVIGDKAADDLRKATPPCPELPQQPRGQRTETPTKTDPLGLMELNSHVV